MGDETQNQGPQDVDATPVSQPAVTSAQESVDEYDTPLWKRFIEMEFRYTDGITADEKYAKETGIVLDEGGFRQFLKPGDKVLDICSGDSEHARRLAELTGAHVEARDLSKELVSVGIEATKARIAQTGVSLSVNSDVGNMGNIKAAIKPGEKFKAVTIFGSAFLYLENHQSHVQALKDYHDVLEDGGQLAIQWYERDPKRQKDFGDHYDEWLRQQNIAARNFKQGKEPPDPVAPGRYVNSELTDLTQGDTMYIAYSKSNPDRRFVPYPDLGIEIEESTFARGYKHPDGHFEPAREMSHTTNYMLKSKFPVLKRMLEEAGFVNIRLVPEEGKPDVFFSEKGTRKLYAVVAEKPASV